MAGDKATDWIEDLFADSYAKWRQRLWVDMETAQLSDEEFNEMAGLIDYGGLDDLRRVSQFLDGRIPPPTNPKRQLEDWQRNKTI